jgi:hypothetical protein
MSRMRNAEEASTFLFALASLGTVLGCDNNIHLEGVLQLRNLGAQLSWNEALEHDLGAGWLEAPLRLTDST